MVLPDHILILLWRRFSEIQAASWLEVGPEAADRFYNWFHSGDDTEAWS
jgi:hypothetical protein